MPEQIQKSEREFQTWVKRHLEQGDMWFTQIHPGLGADPGLPDLYVDTEAFNHTGCELKIGSAHDADGILWTSQIRPAQIRWHSHVAYHGGFSFFLVGVWSGDEWRVFAIDGAIVDKWENGFEIGTEAIELVPSMLVGEIDGFCFDRFEWDGDNIR